MDNTTAPTNQNQEMPRMERKTERVRRQIRRMSAVLLKILS